MPLIIPSNSISAGGYEVDNSVRLNSPDNAYVYHTNSTPTSDKKYTFSTWVKRSKLSHRGQFLRVINPSSTSAYAFLEFTSDDKVGWNDYDGSVQINFQTTDLFRDTSAWYHFVIKMDTTQSTESDRFKFFINGVDKTSGYSTGITYPSLNKTIIATSSGRNVYIGGDGSTGGSTRKFDGYMAETVLLDGTALDADSFGEFDEDSGIWKPIDVSGLTFGNNGFYLHFENSGSLGADVSGNGNNFTVNNLTAIDQTTDTPTNNFATGNPLDYSGTAPTLGNGNLSITSAELSDKPFRTTIAVSQGKWYMEYKCEKSGSDNDNHIGLWSAENSLTSNYVGYQLYSWGIFTGNGNKRNNQSYDSYGSAIAQNDIVMIALDKDNGKIWWGKNGTWFASGNPATGSNEAFSNINTVVGSNGFVSFCFLPQQKFSLNFGNPPFTISSGNTDANGYGNFEYAVPIGYYALNTKNLSEYG